MHASVGIKYNISRTLVSYIVNNKRWVK